MRLRILTWRDDEQGDRHDRRSRAAAAIAGLGTFATFTSSTSTATRRGTSPDLRAGQPARHGRASSQQATPQRAIDLNHAGSVDLGSATR
jgi:hypothetical protein